MRLELLQERHPSCLAEDFERFSALYEGGTAFRKLIQKFLPPNPMEEKAYYDARSREAPYTSYVGPIIDAFAAQLFASPFHVRTMQDEETSIPDPFYAGLREDVDMNGTDLVAFMKKAFITSLVKGSAWWLAEMPDDEGIPAETRADWEERGLNRVRLCHLEPDQVINWECNDYGALEFVTTYSECYRQRDPRVARTEVTRTWKIYDDKSVETFQIVYDPKKRRLKPKDDIPSLGKVDHRFSRIPIVQMRLPVGLWLMNRASDAQIEHFRLSAALSWAGKRTCYPIAIFKTNESGARPEQGSGFMQRIAREDTIEWIAPPSDSLEIIKGMVFSQMTEIHRVTHQMAQSVDNSSAALGRSGESKVQDNLATEICLHAYAEIVRAAIESTFELVSDGRGEFDVKFSIEGMNKFSLNDVTTTIKNMKTSGATPIIPKTLLKELSMKLADLLLPDASQQVKDTIREEIEEEAEKPKPEPPTPAIDQATSEDGEGDGPSKDVSPTAAKPTARPAGAELNQN